MELIREYSQKKIADYLRFERPQKVCLIFWHGLGDLVLFLKPFDRLKTMFPDIQIDLALQEGVGQEDLLNSPPSLLSWEERGDVRLITNPNIAIDGYDITFQVHFPMAEHTVGLWTKAEFCCREELGIEPISTLPILANWQGQNSNQVAVHFQATALPEPCNPSYDVAKHIWSEIKEAGFEPIEAFYVHRYFNPVNKKFDFIDKHVRDDVATVENLTRLLQGCYVSICVASGNLPMSLGILPADRVLYLKKAYDISCYTRLGVPQVDINQYKGGSVKEWLSKK